MTLSYDFSDQNKLNMMIALAAVSHAGQFDKGGKPYILHVLKVLHYVDSDDEELNCIAVGHDLIEDTDVTAEVLREMGFSERVVLGIVALTKVKGEPYENYKSRVKRYRDTRTVKKADLRHNSDIRRLKGVTTKDIERMVKYHEFYLELEEMD